MCRPLAYLLVAATVMVVSVRSMPYVACVFEPWSMTFIPLSQVVTASREVESMSAVDGSVDGDGLFRESLDSLESYGDLGESDDIEGRSAGGVQMLHAAEGETVKGLIDTKMKAADKTMAKAKAAQASKTRAKAGAKAAKAAEKATEKKETRKENGEKKKLEQKAAKKQAVVTKATEKAAEAEEDVNEAEKGGFDPTAPGAEERVMNLKEKLQVAAQREQYAKEVQVADTANEMSFKVRAKDADAVKAGATVEQMQDGTPSVNGQANEMIIKQRDQWKMKELETKSKQHGRQKKKPKKANPLDKTGAAVAVALRAAMSAAKAALLYKDENPGDKRAEIRAGEAMAAVDALTKKQLTANKYDADLHRRSSRELSEKALELEKDKELKAKKLRLSDKKAFAAAKKIIDDKKQEAEKLKVKMTIAGERRQLDKKLAKLAMRREKTNLKRGEFLVAERAKKKDKKSREQVKVKNIKAKEASVKATATAIEREQKAETNRAEAKVKGAVHKLDKTRTDEVLERKRLKGEKKSVVALIKKAERFNLKQRMELKDEKRRLGKLGADGKTRLKDFKALQAKANLKSKSTLMRKVNQLTMQKADIDKQLESDKKSSKRLKLKIKLAEKAEQKDEEQDERKLLAKKEKETTAAAKTVVKAKMKLYEEAQKQKIRTKLESSNFKKAIIARMVKQAKLEKQLGETLDTPTMKKRIDENVAKLMQKKLKASTFTVSGAREEEAMLVAGERNRMRNGIWRKLVAKQASVEKISQKARSSGLYLKNKAKAEQIRDVPLSERRVIRRAMNEERDHTQAKGLHHLKWKNVKTHVDKVNVKPHAVAAKETVLRQAKKAAVKPALQSLGEVASSTTEDGGMSTADAKADVASYEEQSAIALHPELLSIKSELDDERQEAGEQLDRESQREQEKLELESMSKEEKLQSEWKHAEAVAEEDVDKDAGAKPHRSVGESGSARGQTNDPLLAQFEDAITQEVVSGGALRGE